MLVLVRRVQVVPPLTVHGFRFSPDIQGHVLTFGTALVAGLEQQLGAPLGFLMSAGIFLLLGRLMDDAAFLAWGWRVPFLASALLVIVGLWVRLNIHETPDFKKALERKAPVRLPMWTVLRDHPVPMLLGTLGAFATFVLFYLMTVFTLGYGTSVLGYSREQFLLLQMVGILFFAAGIPLSAMYGDRWGTRRTMIVASGLIGIGLYLI